jgi:myosin heavy subunit
MLDSQCLEKNISNLIELHHLSENAVLHVLRNRYRDDHIYTFVSSILVAVNPFRDIPIYGNDWIERYRSTDHRNLPPHIFVTADNAYNYLIRNYLSQSIVISGESGSGKTESIKLILKYITHISRKNAANHRNIQEQILEANPVMEAFGNAKTSRNNNRFEFLSSSCSSSFLSFDKFLAHDLEN